MSMDCDLKLASTSEWPFLPAVMVDTIGNDTQPIITVDSVIADRNMLENIGLSDCTKLTVGTIECSDCKSNTCIGSKRQYESPDSIQSTEYTECKKLHLHKSYSVSDSDSDSIPIVVPSGPSPDTLAFRKRCVDSVKRIYPPSGEFRLRVTSEREAELIRDGISINGNYTNYAKISPERWAVLASDYVLVRGRLYDKTYPACKML